MKTEVVVYNQHYSKTSAVTYVIGKEGRIATFPYDPSNVQSVIERLRSFATFSIVRNIDVIEVLGEDLVFKCTK